MLFGYEYRLPCDLFFDHPSYTPLSPEEYFRDLLAHFEDINFEDNFALERINIATEKTKMKTRYNIKATRHEFQEGEKVWLWNLIRRKGFSPKLKSNSDGLNTVLKKLNVVIRIRKSLSTKPKLVGECGLKRDS